MKKSSHDSPSESLICRFIPAICWLRDYNWTWLRGDLIAGVTLAAYLLPAGMGDASLARLPPEAGLYACLFSGLVFWLFCSSRHTSIAVTSAISMLLGASLGDLAGGDVTRFGTLASATSFIVAFIALAAWLARAGDIVRFISESVMIGFKCGVALYLTSSQLPKLFGFHGAHGDFWQNSYHFLKHLSQTNVASLGIGLGALGILILGKIYLKNKPIALLVVVGGIALSMLLHLEDRNVKLLGEVPQGLPSIGLPIIDWSDINTLLPLAIASFLLGAVETAAIGRMYAAKHGNRFSVNQEFRALAAANFSSGLGRGFPVSGGLSQSAVNEGAGARTPLSGAIAAGLILIVVLFFSQLLEALPQPVLAAVVLVAVAGLFKVSALRELWSGDRREFTVAMAALIGVLGSGLLRGVMIGAIVSLVQVLRAASRPHIALLGQIPGTNHYADHARHPENELIPGIIIFRPESSLIYFNVAHVCDFISRIVRADPLPPKLVVLDLSASPNVDLQSALALAEMADQLAADGIRVQAVQMHAAVRERLRQPLLHARLGAIDRHMTVAGAVEAFQSAD